jgi:hypothetical protein
MSVLDELSKHAQNPEDKFQGAPFNEGANGMPDMQGMMESVPIPGQGLTQDPASRLPHETPPEFTDLQEFTEYMFVTMSAPDKLPDLLEILRKGVPAEYLAERVLKDAMGAGKITPDLLMSAIEPTLYLIMSLGTYGGVDVVVYPEDDMIETASDSTAMFKQKTQSLMADEIVEPTGDPVVPMQAPPNIPVGLMQRGKAAVENVSITEGMENLDGT